MPFSPLSTGNAKKGKAMSAENDLIKLYSGRILELAADIPRCERLEAPDATVKKRSPLCGSTVTVDLRLSDGQISDFGQDVKACALGQAAASVVGGAIVGCHVDDVRAARAALKSLLKEDGPTPPPPFDGLEVLRPAASFKNRHASIMLTLDAACEAIEQLQADHSA
jgi:NifU-like protein involved in Fe-S cluster formation